MVSQKRRKKHEKYDMGRLWRARGSQDSPRVPHKTNFRWFGVPQASNFNEKTRFSMMEMFPRVSFSSLTEKIFSSHLSRSAPALRIKPPTGLLCESDLEKEQILEPPGSPQCHKTIEKPMVFAWFYLCPWSPIWLQNDLQNGPSGLPGRSLLRQMHAKGPFQKNS